MVTKLSWFIAVIVFCGGNLHADTIVTIDTFPAVDATIHSLGEGDGAQTYGQTFVAPADAPVLTSFTVSARALSVFHSGLGELDPLLPGDTTFDFGVME